MAVSPIQLMTALAALALALPVAAADWPQLWGPRSSGVAEAARLPEVFKLRELWRRPLGSGYSGVSVSGTRGFTAFSDGSDDHAIAFDADSGRELWRARLGPTHRGHDGSRDGPMSTPALDGGRAFLVSAHGLLLALDAGSGRVLWQHDLKAEYGAPGPYHGFATSPLVAGPLLIVHVGGESHNLAAFDKSSGTLRWSARHSATSNYSSPVHATLGGVPQVVVLANDKVYGVRLQDGSLIWSHPIGWSEEAMRAPLPLPEDRLLVPGWNETKLLKLNREGEAFAVSQLWATARLKGFSSPTVPHDGLLFGFNGSFLVALDPADAEPAWRQRVYDGSLILVDGRLFVLGAQSGELRVVPAARDGYREKLRQPVFNPGATSVTGPSFANGRLYLRNLEELVALEVVR